MLIEEQNVYNRWIEVQNRFDYPPIKLLQAAGELRLALDWYERAMKGNQADQVKMAAKKAKIWAKELAKRMNEVGQ